MNYFPKGSLARRVIKAQMQGQFGPQPKPQPESDPKTYAWLEAAVKDLAHKGKHSSDIVDTLLAGKYGAYWGWESIADCVREITGDSPDGLGEEFG